MQLILLSGGSGKRLWPMSNDVRSKQFLKVLKSPSGEMESMVQRVVRQIKDENICESITFATSAKQWDSILAQVGADAKVVTEPERRDTFPAIALACSYLAYAEKLPADEVVVAMPCDVFTESGYFKVIERMSQVVEKGGYDIVLMGIEPDSPSSKYGYIIPAGEEKDGATPVKEFKEKPDRATAEKYLQQGALWNGGVFAFRLSLIIDILKKYIKSNSFEYVKEHYADLPKISFDYEVVEKAKSIGVVRYKGQWKDLGSWDALSANLADATIGSVMMRSCENTHVINELEIPMVCVGANNLMIAATPDGILISDKSASDTIKNEVGDLNQRPMYEDRRWGFYRVLGTTNHGERASLTKHLHLNPGATISYQTHDCRNEVWTFVNGEGLLVVDDVVKKVGSGETAIINVGQKHTIKAITHLDIIEVQTGKNLVEEDIKRYPWDWSACEK